MKWIETAGGPFAIVSLDDVPLWTGYRGDYQRACEVDGVTGLIEFGDPERRRVAIILWDEPLRTTYLPELQTVVQWLYADSEDGLIQMVNSKISSAEWEGGHLVEICGTALLFDSAVPGVELSSDDSLEVRLDGGAYEVRTAEIESGDRRAARIHRFFQVDK